MHFEKVHLYGYKNDFEVITYLLSISRWEILSKINDCRIKAAVKYLRIKY